MSSSKEVQEALDVAQQMARSQEAWEGRLKLAQEALKPQGAHGETRYRVSMQATLVSHCGECGSSLSGTRSQKRLGCSLPARFHIFHPVRIAQPR